MLPRLVDLELVILLLQPHENWDDEPVPLKPSLAIATPKVNLNECICLYPCGLVTSDVTLTLSPKIDKECYHRVITSPISATLGMSFRSTF